VTGAEAGAEAGGVTLLLLPLLFDDTRPSDIECTGPDDVNAARADAAAGKPCVGDDARARSDAAVGSGTRGAAPTGLFALLMPGDTTTLRGGVRDAAVGDEPNADATSERDHSEHTRATRGTYSVY
jgi:hypothetical protein